MRCKKQTVAVAAALFAAFAMPVRLAAQEDQKQRKELQTKEHVRIYVAALENQRRLYRKLFEG